MGIRGKDGNRIPAMVNPAIGQRLALHHHTEVANLGRHAWPPLRCLPATSSSYQISWCSLAQDSSTSPVFMASKEPSIPMVPMSIWPRDMAMTRQAEVACTIWAYCMAARVSTRLGKVSASPETTMIMPKKHRPAQNQTFSPKLKRREGTCSPLASPPALRIHSASDLCQRLSFQNMANKGMTPSRKKKPAMMCRFLEKPASQEKSV